MNAAHYFNGENSSNINDPSNPPANKLAVDDVRRLAGGGWRYSPSIATPSPPSLSYPHQPMTNSQIKNIDKRDCGTQNVSGWG